MAGEDSREVQALWPLFKYQRAGDQGLVRIWPLFYRHTGDRIIGVARYKEPTDELVGSDVFTLMENSWEGQLSSIALFGTCSDDYSRARSLLHPSLLTVYSEENRKHWPAGASTQPRGVYSMIAPWWLVDYVLRSESFVNRYFPPVTGYDSYAGEFKLLMLYFRRRQMDIQPAILGLGYGPNSHIQLWPVISSYRQADDRDTRILWQSRKSCFTWSPAWELDTE